MIQHSADFLRIGSKHDSTEPLSNLRAMRIYRTIAVHSSSTPTIDDVLNSKEDFLTLGVTCPKLLVTSSPACEAVYVYYKMDTAGQTIVDYSREDNLAINGEDISNLSQDCGL